VLFLRQDFATLQLPQPVDLITSNFDSLNYLLTPDDLLRALHRFHANLKTGGPVIFDMITDRRPWQSPGPHVERASGPGVTFTRVTRWDPRHCLQTAIISISRNEHTHRETHTQRGYPVAMIVGLLAQAGFDLLGVYNFHTLGPPTSRTSRAIYVACRA
jgi:hypothetical protein